MNKNQLTRNEVYAVLNVIEYACNQVSGFIENQNLRRAIEKLEQIQQEKIVQYSREDFGEFDMM